MRYVNLFTPLPYALLPQPRPENLLVVITLFGCLRSLHCKNAVRTGGKILFRSVLRRGQRVRAGSVCYICVLLVISCVIKGQRYIFSCITKPALSSWIYFVSKKFHNCVILNCVV
jgi:hypothetical protein